MLRIDAARGEARGEAMDNAREYVCVRRLASERPGPDTPLSARATTTQYPHSAPILRRRADADVAAPDTQKRKPDSDTAERLRAHPPRRRRDRGTELRARTVESGRRGRAGRRDGTEEDGGAGHRTEGQRRRRANGSLEDLYDETRASAGLASSCTCVAEARRCRRLVIGEARGTTAQNFPLLH